MKFSTVKILIVFVATFMLIVETESNKDSSLLQILQSVLDDPEFLALDKQKQLGILIATYQLLLNHYNREQDAKDRNPF